MTMISRPPTTTIRAAASTEAPMTLHAAANDELPTNATRVAADERIDETAQLKVASATPCPRPLRLRIRWHFEAVPEITQYTDDFLRHLIESAATDNDDDRICHSDLCANPEPLRHTFGYS